MKNYDLIVAGGGLSGVAAAISAARAGAKVLIFDRFNSFGGAAVTNLVNPFMPYWTRDPETDEKLLLSEGMFTEILDEMSKFPGALSKDRTCFNEEFLKIVLCRMVQKAGVDILFNTLLTSAEKDGETIKSVTLSNTSGNNKYYAKYFIDATGNADLAVNAGCEYHLGRDDGLCQPMTLCFRLGNIDTDKFTPDEKAKMQAKYKELQAEGKIKNIRENVLVFRTLEKGVLHFNTTRVVKLNPTDAEDLTKAEIETREQVIEMYNFLRENVDGFQNCELLSTASQIGIRESRMVKGHHVITEEELRDCTVFEDSIAVGNYDIDIHNPEGSGTSHYYFPKGKYYTLPYSALRPIHTNNLLVAGRCISSTHEAQASYRIMPICCTLGQAAGTAIGVALESNCDVNSVDVKKLQDRLVANGARIY